jgi:hypothetical protein
MQFLTKITLKAKDGHHTYSNEYQQVLFVLYAASTQLSHPNSAAYKVGIYVKLHMPP